MTIISDLSFKKRTDIETQILKGLNTYDPDIEKAWPKEARRRLDDFEQGRTEAILGDQVMRELRRITGK